ncbi:hypothetical protein [Nonomuraea sp. bgisy101]|uniref:hypothetical protein n=1 Tax=Nonomuraea sp. bgisy101 TaxID=3413784 RepID=UPI003D735228
MLEVHARVDVHGPLFDGRAVEAAHDFADAVVDDVADQGFRDIHFTLVRVLKHPTGHYQSNIRNRAFAGGRVLYDNRIIYGHWLEGTGSRNAPKTRFEGYWTFRRVTQGLKRKAPAIAERTLRRYIRRMQ